MTDHLYTILVCGSRKWSNLDTIEHFLIEAFGESRLRYHCSNLRVIHGAANGADRLGAIAAENLGIKNIHPFPIKDEEWDRYGRAAGPMRNKRMLDEKPNLVLAFGDGRGTQNCIDEARKRKIPVIHYRFNV